MWPWECLLLLYEEILVSENNILNLYIDAFWSWTGLNNDYFWYQYIKSLFLWVSFFIKFILIIMLTKHTSVKKFAQFGFDTSFESK